MADYDLSWLDSYDSAIKSTPDQAEKDQAGWLDVPREYGAQLVGLAAAPLGAAQVATASAYPNASDVFGGLSMAAHGAEESLREGETPVSRRAAEATIIPEEGKPSFWEHPIRSAFMQGAGLAAFGTALAGVAAVAPEGLLAGLATDAATGGLLGTAQVADKAAQYYNNPELTDNKLAEEDPRFKMLTEQGVDPKEARNIRMREMVHASPLLANGFAGALGMGVGGRVLRRTTGGTGGVLSRATLGAGENAAGMGGMAAAGTYADQDLEIAQGRRTDYDGRKILMSFANGAALGAAFGTVGGVLHKSDGRRVREDNTPTVERTDNSQLDSTNTVPLTTPEAAAPSVELSTLAAPGSKPVEPSGDKSQGVSEELVAGLKGELPPKVEVATTAPEVPVVHPGEPEAPIATVAHPDVPEVAPPEARAVEPVAPVTQQVTAPAALSVSTGLTHAQHLAEVHAKFPSVFDKLGTDELTSNYADKQHKAALAHETETMESIYGKEDWKKLKSIERRLNSYQTGQQADELIARRNAITDKYNINEETDKIEGGHGYPDEALPDFWKDVRTSLRDVEGGHPKDLAHSLRTAMRDLPTTTDWEKIPTHQKVNLIQADAALRELKKKGVSERDALKRAFIEGVARDGNDARELFQGDLERFKALRDVEEKPAPAPAPTPAPAPALPPTEARVDPATGRRILEGPRWGEGPEWSKLPGQTEEALAAVPKAIKEEPGKGHSAQIVLDQQAKNHEIATRILNSQTPLVPFTENTHANRESLRIRLQEQVSEALASGFGVIKKAKGSPFENRIPDRVHKQPGEVMWLADAQRMLRQLNAKKIPKLDDINKFIADENAGRSGQWDVMAARRKDEGGAFGETKKKEAAAEAAPEEVSGGDAMDRLKSSEPTPEDIILKGEEEPAPAEEETMQEAPSRERPAPKIEGEAYTVPKERTTPVVTARGRGRYEGMRPKVAEKVALSRKEPKEKLRKTEDMLAELTPEEKKIYDDTLHEAERTENTVFSYNHDRGEHVREEALGVTNLKDTFKRLDAYNYEYGLGKFNRALHQVFRNRVLEHVGDMKVFYVTIDQMGRLDNKKTGGYYDPNHKHIVLRVDAAGHPSDAAPLILHEALHAAYHDAIEANPDLKNEIQKMIRAVIGHLRENELDAVSKLSKRAQHDLTYGLTSPHEFISEAFTNKTFQDLLMRVRVPDEMAQRLGLKGKIISAWDWLVNEFRKHLNLPKGAHSMLEAAIKLGEHLEVSRKRVEAQRGKSLEELLDELAGLTASMPRKPLELLRRVDTTEETFRNVLARGAENAHEQLGKFAADPVNRTAELARDIANQPDLSKGVRAFSNIFLTNNMHLQRIKHLDKELVGTIYGAIERSGTYARKLRDAIAPHIADWIRVEKKVPGLYSEAVDIIHQATREGVDPTSALGAGRNERLAVNKKVQAKLDKGAKIEDLINDVNANHINAILAHPELTRRYEALIRKEPKFERLIKDTFSYYDEVQLAESKNIIRNALEATGKFPERADLNKRTDELSDMVITKENTDALRQEIGEAALDHIIKGKSLVGNGPYAPLIRRGEWVVRGKYKIHAPSNALAQTGPNVYEFATKREAVDFARSTGLHAKYDTAYYDPTTGEKTTKLGGVSTAGGPEQRWVATLQHEHMEMHESLKVAQRQYEDLKKTGIFEEIHAPVAHREYHNLSGELTHGAIGSLLRQLEKTDAYRRADSVTQAEMRNSIVAAGNIARAGNRVQSRSLPRRNVPGFSKDFTRNLVEYSTASSYYRAKQVYRPQIDDMLGQLTHSIRNIADKHETDRSVELQEVINRARAPNPEEYTGKFAEIARRIGIWSYIDRMMRISHLILHQTHLPMITAPIIAGRHGVARTYATIASTWRDAFPAMKAGGIDFKNSLYDPLIQGTDYSTFIGGLFKGAKDHAHLVDMIQKLNEDGTIHPQAGIEVHKYTPSQQLGGPLGGLDKTMSYLDTTFRHLTNATEAINRHVGAIAAYRLEFQKLRRQGLTDAAAHEKAVTYAGDTLKNTQGLYSSTNAAPLFKVPYLRPFLQFKQFPQMMYHLMARSLLNGFKKMPEGLTQEAQKEFRMQRADALRGLTYLLTTHALATGVLGGLPTEPLKYIGAVTKALGVTSDDFTAVDRWLYDKAVANFGKEGAEWLMHGLARSLGPDVHHRMGLSSLTSWGLDKVTSAADFKGFLFDQAMGAPGSLAADTFTGIKQIADANNMNEVTTGALKAFPLQAMRDIQKAWTGKGSGKYEYSPFERGVRALGFTPVGEAEEAERKAETYKQVDQYNQERRTLMRKWADADASDKGSAWSRIQKFNKDKPKDSQITMKQLTDAAKRRKKGEDEGDIVHGVRLNKQTRFIGERANAIYN